MMSLPAFSSTSAARSQEQRRGGPIFGPLTHQPSRPPRKGRARGWHPNPAGATQQDTPQTQGVRVLGFGAGVWILRFWAVIVARVPQIEVGTCCPRRDASCHHLAPDASVICSCLPESCRPDFSNSEGRYSFFLGNFWKCQLASFLCVLKC